jgi:uncharacterized membrane protein
MNRSKCSRDTSVMAIASIVGRGDDEHRRFQRWSVKQSSRIWCQAKIYEMNFSGRVLKTMRAAARCAGLSVCLMVVCSQPAISKPLFLKAFPAGDTAPSIKAAQFKASEYIEEQKKLREILGVLVGGFQGYFAMTLIQDSATKKFKYEVSFVYTDKPDPLVATVAALRADGSIVPHATSETIVVAGMTEIEGSIPITQDGQTFQITPQRAFRWTITEGVQDLGVLPTFDHSVATAISSDGHTVVGQVSRQINSANYTNFGYAQHAFRWTEALGMQDLGPTTSTASGVSGDGSVVIGQLANNGAFRWNLSNASTGGGVVTQLSAVPTTAFARAIAISSDGITIVGDSTAGGVGMPTLPVRWVAGGPPQSIGVPAGMVSATAAAVSDDGSVIVGVAGPTIGTYSYSPATGFTIHDTESAFRWTQPTGTQTLDVLAAAGGIDMTGSSFLGATSMSGDGQFIGGLKKALIPGTTATTQSGYVLRDCDPTTSAACAAIGTSSTTPNYEGLWWNSPAGSESGWGINFAHQGDVIFATWFTYDLNGKAWWLSMIADKTADGVYAGSLVQTHGPAFSAVPFSPSAVTASTVGSGTLTFTDDNTGTFAYTVNGISQSKPITREVFATPPTCVFGAQTDLTTATNYQDLWYAAPVESEAGWGVNLTHQSDTIFATWFTYDFDGTPLWLSAVAPKTAPGVYSGPLVRTTGPAFNAVPFSPAQIGLTPVGSLTISFANGNSASFAYTVTLPGAAAVTQTKSVTRQVFRTPGTVCH